MRSMLIRAAAPAALAALLSAPALAADYGQNQGTASPAQEQTQMQGEAQGQPATQGQAAAQFEDAKLQSFAAAASGIRDVAREYAPRLRDAESAEQAAQLEQEAQEAMMQQVEDEGLTVEEYNRIAVAAQQDPQLAATIEGYIAVSAG